MKLNTFASFLTVVEEMSFTKAAQRLYVTQQSLSGQIKRLEEEFGVTLFERRPVLRLTPEGEKMYFYAQQMLQMQDAIVSDFADQSTNRRAYCDGKGAAIVSPMVLYNSRERTLNLPEDCHIFRIKEARSNAVSMAYMEDARLPRYAEEMMDIIRETFKEYADEISRLGLARIV